MMKTTNCLLSLTSALLVWHHPVSVHSHWRNSCETHKLPTVKVQPHPETGILQILQRWEAGVVPQELEENDFDPYYLHRRHLLQDDDHQSFLRGHHDFTLGVVIPSSGRDTGNSRVLHANHDHADDHGSSTTNLHNATGDDGSGIFYAKECSCFPDMYDDTTVCPFTTESCRQVIDTHGVKPYPRYARCEDQEAVSQMFYLSIWIAWAIFLSTCFLTHRGRSALSYLPAKVCRCWNPLVVSFLERFRKPFANQLIRTHFVVQEERLIRLQLAREGSSGNDSSDEPQEGVTTGGIRITAIEMATRTVLPPPPKPPTSLALKTRVYTREEEGRPSTGDGDHHDNSNNHDEDEHNNCAICLTPLKAGDRVGALACSHAFHVECLKSWLQRRNACPLCQADEAAEPRFDEEDATTAADTSGQTTEEGSMTTEENSSIQLPPSSTTTMMEEDRAL